MVVFSLIKVNQKATNITNYNVLSDARDNMHIVFKREYYFNKRIIRCLGLFSYFHKRHLKYNKTNRSYMHSCIGW